MKEKLERRGVVDIDAQHYKENSSTQFHLAEDVLAQHTFQGDEDVLDMGCGDGKVTAKIASQVPNGHVLGVDPSPSMIKLARDSFPLKDVPNVKFAEGSAESFSCQKIYDVVTAFSCLHWVRGQKNALRHMLRLLKTGGRFLSLTFPRESPYFRLLEEVIHEKKWRTYEESSACQHWLSSREYEELFTQLNFKIHEVSTRREAAFYHNKDALKKYVKGWLPCLIALPRKEEDAFLGAIANRAHQQYGKCGFPGFELPYDKIVIHVEKRKEGEFHRNEEL